MIRWLVGIFYGECTVCGRRFRKVDSVHSAICDGECFAWALMETVGGPAVREHVRKELEAKRARYAA